MNAAPVYLPEKTIHYKTYLKRSLVQALRDVFKAHPDSPLQETKVTLDNPRTEADYPAVVIKFYERKIENAGIGHEEIVDLSEDDNTPIGSYRFKHYFYWGDVEFALRALSPKSLDLVADTLVQTIAMGNLESYTNRFFTRIYPDEGEQPESVWHSININADQISGFGEGQSPTPWMSEDDLVYEVNYRVSVFGEFYSPPPEFPMQYISDVIVYPWFEGVEEVPTGDPNDGAPWI